MGIPVLPQPAMRLVDQGENLISNGDNVTVELVGMNGTAGGCAATEQGVLEFPKGSSEAPCGVPALEGRGCRFCRNGLGILQPFCPAESLRDRAAQMCALIVAGNGSSGTQPLPLGDGEVLPRPPFLDTRAEPVRG